MLLLVLFIVAKRATTQQTQTKGEGFYKHYVFRLGHHHAHQVCISQTPTWAQSAQWQLCGIFWKGMKWTLFLCPPLLPSPYERLSWPLRQLRKAGEETQKTLPCLLPLEFSVLILVCMWGRYKALYGFKSLLLWDFLNFPAEPKPNTQWDTEFKDFWSEPLSGCPGPGCERHKKC